MTSFIRKLWRANKYRYRLPLLYLGLVFFGLITLLIPGLNECNGGLFVVCFPIALIIVILIGTPGYKIIKSLEFVIPKEYYSWVLRSENILIAVMPRYIVTLFLFYFLGLVIDKLQGKKEENSCALNHTTRYMR